MRLIFALLHGKTARFDLFSSIGILGFSFGAKVPQMHVFTPFVESMRPAQNTIAGH